jgi:hypothetical protein
MIKPQSLNVLLGEYSEGHQVWAIEARSGRYLSIPDPRFPGKLPIRFFTTEYDAMRVMETLLEVKPSLEAQRFEVVEVHLLHAVRKAKAEKTFPIADSFVINTHAEVYPIIDQLKQKPPVKPSTPTR